jgi:hydroxymethylpyrimidine pyrophosphatase-like HAD family hydrolase
MIFEIIQIITEQVNNYLDEIGLDKPVVAENIAFLESSQSEDVTTALKDSVALTLINLDEEATLKNFPNHAIENAKTIYKNSIINLNLYLLFSANRDKYLNSLNDISKIIAFFQGKKLFTQANTIYNRNNIAMSNINNFRFTVELYTPTFEELNYIWGTLGGKQLPSALYKVSMIQIERDIAQAEGQLISKVKGVAKTKEQS